MVTYMEDIEKRGGKLEKDDSNTNWMDMKLDIHGGREVGRVEEYKDLSRGSRQCLMHSDSNKDTTTL